MGSSWTEIWYLYAILTCFALWLHQRIYESTKDYEKTPQSSQEGHPRRKDCQEEEVLRGHREDTTTKLKESAFRTYIGERLNIEYHVSNRDKINDASKQTNRISRLPSVSGQLPFISICYQIRRLQEWFTAHVSDRTGFGSTAYAKINIKSIQSGDFHTINKRRIHGSCLFHRLCAQPLRRGKHMCLLWAENVGWEWWEPRQVIAGCNCQLHCSWLSEDCRKSFVTIIGNSLLGKEKLHWKCWSPVSRLHSQWCHYYSVNG